jgi:hypothetical protein
MASSDDTDRTDELASAYLDGELDEAERAVVQGDPALLARVEELRAASEAVAAPTAPLPSDRSDDLVANALRAGAVPAARRPSWRSRLPSPATAAAAVLVVLLAGLTIVFFAQLGDGGNDAADETSAGDSGTGGAAEEDIQESQEGAATSTTDSATDSPGDQLLGPGPSLGTFATDDQLRAALGRVGLERLARGADPEPNAAGQPPPPLDRCADAVGAQLAPRGRLAGAATATVSGEPVLVFHHRLDGGDDQLSVADPVTCAIRFAVQR